MDHNYHLLVPTTHYNGKLLKAEVNTKYRDDGGTGLGPPALIPGPLFPLCTISIFDTRYKTKILIVYCI